MNGGIAADALGNASIERRRAALELLREAHLILLMTHGQLTQQLHAQARDFLGGDTQRYGNDTATSGYISARFTEAQILIRRSREALGWQSWAPTRELSLPSAALDWLEGFGDAVVLADVHRNVAQNEALAREVAALFAFVAASSPELASVRALPELSATDDDLSGWQKLFLNVTGKDPRFTPIWPIVALVIVVVAFFLFAALSQQG